MFCFFLSTPLTLRGKYLLLGRPDAIHRATIRLTDIANLLDKDWEPLAEELNIPPNDIALIKQEYPDKPAQQAAAMFKIWQNNGNKATGKCSRTYFFFFFCALL